VPGLQVITIETPSLGDRSYIAHDGTKALVIDPQRDIDRVLPRRGARSGRHACRRDAHPQRLRHRWVRARAPDRCDLRPQRGRRGVLRRARRQRRRPAPRRERSTSRVMHTPGHTPTHLSYIVTDGSARRRSPAARCCTARSVAPTSSRARWPRSSPASSSRAHAGSRRARGRRHRPPDPRVRLVLLVGGRRRADRGRRPALRRRDLHHRPQRSRTSH
jgi:hypothetical protein